MITVEKLLDISDNQLLTMEAMSMLLLVLIFVCALLGHRIRYHGAPYDWRERMNDDESDDDAGNGE